MYWISECCVEYSPLTRRYQCFGDEAKTILPEARLPNQAANQPSKTCTVDVRSIEMLFSLYRRLPLPHYQFCVCVLYSACQSKISAIIVERGEEEDHDVYILAY